MTEVIAPAPAPEYERRYFRLRKDTPILKAGGVFIKRKLGDYILLDDYSEHIVGDAVAKHIGFTEATIVEDQPEWFEEVFPVVPRYMTREDLGDFQLWWAERSPKKNKGGRPLGSRNRKKKASK